MGACGVKLVWYPGYLAGRDFREKSLLCSEIVDLMLGDEKKNLELGPSRPG